MYIRTFVHAAIAGGLLAGCTARTETVYVYLEAGAPADAAPLHPDAGAPTSDAAAPVDAAPPADAGTGYLGDPCDPVADRCVFPFACYATHTPTLPQDMFHRCTVQCNDVANYTAACTGEDGLCKPLAPSGTSATICVPAH